MRVKRGVTKHKRHKKIRLATKGMTRSRRSSYRLGKQAVVRALQYSYRDRRNRKRDFRSLWITRINAAARENGLSYSQLISGLKANNISLDRKILSELAVSEPQVFSEIVKQAKS